MNTVDSRSSKRAMKAFALAIALAASSGSAQTVYSWEDKDGVHYTDDVTQVPAKAKNRTEEKFEPSRPVATAKPEVTSPEAKSAKAAQTAQAETEAETERLWRERFITLRRRVDTQRDLVSRLKVVQANASRATCVPQQLNGRTYPCQPNYEYDRVSTQLAVEQTRLEELERELEQLDREASQVGVPREWRRGF
jgi:hypothetical protein